MAIDEFRHAELHRAGPMLIAGNQPVAGSSHEGPFVGVEEGRLVGASKLRYVLSGALGGVTASWQVHSQQWEQRQSLEETAA